MLYTSHISRLPFREQDELYNLAMRLGGWASILVDSVVYTVPSDRAYLLYILDSNLVPASDRDYID
jgi:hypothetical protein